jgi:hypothetical protein
MACGKEDRDCICQARLQEKVDNWNLLVKVGDEVTVKRDDGSFFDTRTRSEAWVVGGHTPVVCVEGITGCFLLERIKPRRGS